MRRLHPPYLVGKEDLFDKTAIALESGHYMVDVRVPGSQNTVIGLSQSVKEQHNQRLITQSNINRFK